MFKRNSLKSFCLQLQRRNTDGRQSAGVRRRYIDRFLFRNLKRIRKFKFDFFTLRDWIERSKSFPPMSTNII